jgi:hypothetical protein
MTRESKATVIGVKRNPSAIAFIIRARRSALTFAQAEERNAFSVSVSA